MAFSDHFKAKIGADTASLEQSVKKANKKVKTFSKDIGGMFSQFLAVGAVTAFLGKLASMTSSLQEVSDKLGVSTDFLQKFRYASEQSGVKITEAEMGLQRFLRRAGTASKDGGPLLDTLKELGVELKDTNGNVKKGEDLFLDFAEAIGKVKDPNEKLVQTFKLVDSEGVNMLKMIKDGRGQFDELAKKAEELGLVLDNKTINSIKTTEEELLSSRKEFEALAVDVLPLLIGALNLAVNGWKALHSVCELINVEIQLFADYVKGKFKDGIDVISATIDNVKAKVNAFTVSINPFATQQEIDQAHQASIKAMKALDTASANYQRSLITRRKETLSKDKELFDAKIHYENRLSDTLDKISGKKQNQIQIDEQSNLVLGDTLDITEKIDEKRTDINVKITNALDRIKALKRGGEQELATTIRRQKAEGDIIKLMKDGMMTRKEAEGVVNKLLALEQQEKDLIKDIKDEAQRILDIEKERADRQKLMQQLIDEKQLQQDIKNINLAINIARQNGNDIEVKILREKRMQLQVQGLNVVEADKELQKLKDQLGILDDKRAKMDQNLVILDLLAQGRDKEAKQLQAQIDQQDKINQLANDLKITKQEAKDIVDKELELNKKIKLAKIDEEIKQKQINAVRELAQKKVHDGVDREEKKRIRLAKKIEHSENMILGLKDKQDANAQKAVAYWEDVKHRSLELFLDDATNQDLAELQDQRTALGDQFDVHKDALDQALQAIQAEEAIAHANNVAEELALKALKAENLQAQKDVIDEAKVEFGEAGGVVQQGVADAGDAVVDKIEEVDLSLMDNNTKIVTQLQALALEVAKIAPAISGIQFPSFPSIPAPAPTIVKVDIDTSDLSKETTQMEVKETLKGYFVNQ